MRHILWAKAGRAAYEPLGKLNGDWSSKLAEDAVARMCGWFNQSSRRIFAKQPSAFGLREIRQHAVATVNSTTTENVTNHARHRRGARPLPEARSEICLCIADCGNPCFDLMNVNVQFLGTLPEFV